ncbi:MAG TPA: peptide deformylase [Armatimonadetes bacterium]|nr:peptide deformylase [Armatimonadota bacterium]
MRPSKPSSTRFKGRVRKVVLLGHPALRTRAQPVRKVTPKIRALIQDMFATLHDCNGLGLAANQVGVLHRVFVVRYDEKAYALINPEVVWHSDDIEEQPEGCLSIPQVQGTIPRHKRLRVRAWDESGARIQVEVEGMLARIFQHEIDHLDGVLILDRAIEGTLQWVLRETDESGEETITIIPTTSREVESVFRMQSKRNREQKA